MLDLLVIGGGVIGLSAADEAARAGCRVGVIERGSFGQESSWAGAGILPPGADHPLAPPLERLAALSRRLHPEWAERLREATGIDNGYRRCGGLYLALDDHEVTQLHAAVATWQAWGVDCQMLDPSRVEACEPRLGPVVSACRLADEGQLRNPRHLRALIAACTAGGVQLEAGVECHAWLERNGRVEGVETNLGPRRAANYLITGGAWSAGLARSLGVSLDIRPVRGQMVLLNLPTRGLRQVVNAGLSYLVPRDDGRLLVGSTEEDVGFEKGNTAEGVHGLLALARRLVPSLAGARFERCWSGLRPATRDGLPYLGRVPRCENVYLAAGHYRQGLQLSCATAVCLTALIRGESVPLDLTPFRLDRPSGPPCEPHPRAPAH